MKIVPPTTCPSCDSSLELVKDQLFCRNNCCPAQNSKKVQNFCKKLKIKGFGEKTVDQLAIVSITELLQYTAEYGKQCGLGDKTAQNLEDSVTKFLSAGCEMSELLGALSINLIGDSAGRKIQDALQNCTDVLSIDSRICEKAGLGEKATASLLNYIRDELDPMILEIKIKAKTKTLAQDIESKGDVCITGKLNNFKNRAEAAEYLETQGWTVKKSVTKTVKYLICEDGSNGSSVTKAIKNNIEVLTIEELISKG